MLVLDGVADHHLFGFADREVVEVGAGVELDLVADDRGGALAGRRGGRGDGQDRAVVDVGIVGERRRSAGPAFSLAAAGVGIGDRAVIGAGDGDRERSRKRSRHARPRWRS